MSEIAKCPLCGSELSGSVDGIIECKTGCSFRCGGYALPRIAAAMELAKVRVDYHKVDESYGDEEVKDMWEAVNAANKRVLEVFK